MNRFRAGFFIALLSGALLVPSPASLFASTMAVQPDGKIVLAGSVSQWTPYCITPVRLHRCFLHRVSRPAAVRLDADGHPDSSFGVGGGIVDFRSGGFESVAVLPGQGIRLGSGNGSRFKVIALDAAGDPDFGFGRDGMASSPPATADSASLTTILSQPDGSLVVGGELVTYAPKSLVVSSSVAVAMGFSASGVPGQRLGEVSPKTEGSTVSFGDLVPQGQSDAFVAVGGLSGFKSISGFLARFSASAFPYDASFGGGSGLVQLGPFSGDESVSFNSVAADHGGLIAVGSAGSRVLLARYRTDGTLDSSFGEGGLVKLSVPVALTSLPAGFGSAGARSVAVQADGRYVVAGRASISALDFCDIKSPMCSRTFLARFEPDGSLDKSFGEGGFAMARVFRSVPGSQFGLVVQSDGKILFSDSPLRVAAYNADGNLDTSFGEGGEASLRPCRGTLAQRRRSGCLSKATVDLKVHGLSTGRPVSQFSIRASNPLDPIAAVKLLLPTELEGRRGTAGKVRVLTVPRHRVRVKVRPRTVSVTRLANARSLHVGIGAGVLRRIAPIATAQRLLFRVEVKFKDGTSKLFGFRSLG